MVIWNCVGCLGRQRQPAWSCCDGCWLRTSGRGAGSTAVAISLPRVMPSATDSARSKGWFILNGFTLGCEDWQQWAFAGCPAIRNAHADTPGERLQRILEQGRQEAVVPLRYQAGYFPSMYSFRYWFSTSLTFNCALTTSPMETTPCSLPFSTIGICRTRFSVITAWI